MVRRSSGVLALPEFTGAHLTSLVWFEENRRPKLTGREVDIADVDLEPLLILPSVMITFAGCLAPTLR